MSLKCNLCVSLFDEKSHVPRVLGNCGHSICQECLKNLIENTQIKFKGFKNMFLKCPFDNADHLLKDNFTVLNFPKNYSILEILEHKKEKTKKQKPLQKNKSKSITSLLSLKTRIEQNKDFLHHYTRDQFQKDLNKIYFQKKQSVQKQKSLQILQKSDQKFFVPKKQPKMKFENNHQKKYNYFSNQQKLKFDFKTIFDN